MSNSHGEIHHVSDTALMVAACRALETKSEDGFVRDPFAARLAGERGFAMLRALPYPELMQFGLGMRSRFLDELLLDGLAAGKMATVICLGCGLDTRPWRLDLPADLRWIEVDFTDMLDYKDRLMAEEVPRCRRERVSADLNNHEQRKALYQATGQAPSLLITEGLLMYLPAASVESLAKETRQETGVTHWISDITTTAFSDALNNREAMRSIRNVQASDALPGEQILEVLRQNGWMTEARRSYITDLQFAAARIGRMMQNSSRREPPAFAPGDPTGVHRFVRE